MPEFTDALLYAVAARVQQSFTRERLLAEQIAVQLTVEAVAAVEIETGWPGT